MWRNLKPAGLGPRADFRGEAWPQRARSVAATPASQAGSGLGINAEDGTGTPRAPFRAGWLLQPMQEEHQRKRPRSNNNNTKKNTPGEGMTPPRDGVKNKIKSRGNWSRQD